MLGCYKTKRNSSAAIHTIPPCFSTPTNHGLSEQSPVEAEGCWVAHLQPCWARRRRGSCGHGWTAGGWASGGAWAGGWRGARAGGGAGGGWLRGTAGAFCGGGWTRASWEVSLVESGSERRTRRSCCRTERPRSVVSCKSKATSGPARPRRGTSQHKEQRTAVVCKHRH